MSSYSVHVGISTTYIILFHRLQRNTTSWYINGFPNGSDLCTATETAADSTSTSNIVHSVFYANGLSRYRGVDGYVWCQTRVCSKSRVTTRCTGRGEVGKMTHQPTVTETYKNTQSKFDPFQYTTAAVAQES